MDQEQLIQEMNNGILITIEAVDKRIANKVVTVLDTALKYEFKDKKFVVINSITISELSAIARAYLNQPLQGATRLLLSNVILSETVNIIKENLVAGNNVICTGFITDLFIELSDYYNSDIITDTMILLELIISKNSEIVLISSVPENDISAITRLQRYSKFINEAVKGNSGDVNMSYRIDDVSMDNIDDITNQIIGIIGTRLFQHDKLKEFANDLFGDDKSQDNREENI